ncbi:hypothetical protein PsorP6_001960 [Peronosclerospora sorghi]|uniref:Uncharacterized protein n=1 Tax=Peronosclerospora sorghi TaxID=230839 RepID=A0ACC0WW04_9STRA|nr:hypothetical protein PsorP6_001960 [Peronosclerospora sorghi]
MAPDQDSSIVRTQENRMVEWLPPLPENRDDTARDDEYDIGEPDPKRLRFTDDNEIALAVLEIPRSYK